MEATNMTVEIGGETYDVLPGGTCDGCAFQKQCERKWNAPAPVFNDYTLCADIDVIFKRRTK